MSVNGAVVRELGQRADPAHDRIVVDGEAIHLGARRTVMLHKPRGVVSTRDDPEGRATVVGLLRGIRERLYPVGRLDVNSTGLLLLTNDGALAARLTHPRHRVPRVYSVKVRGAPDDAAVARLRRGVRLEDGKTQPALVRVVHRLPTKSWLEVSVREGRKNLVRRMCEAVGHPVDKLARVRLGPLVLGDLPAGAWRDLTPRELAALRIAAGFSARRRAEGAAARGRRARDRRPRRPRPRLASPPPDGGRGGGAGPAADGPPARRRPPRPRRS